MKLQIKTLTGDTQEVEANPKDTVLDLKVSLLCTDLITEHQ